MLRPFRIRPPIKDSGFTKASRLIKKRFWPVFSITSFSPSSKWPFNCLAIESSVAAYSSESASRMAMWRQNHAIMVKPAGSFEINEEEPVIPGFRFKPEIHVFGLGFTIGSCFIGVPLVGVPVEQRSTAITFFVCAADAG